MQPYRLYSLSPSFLFLPVSTTPSLHVFVCGICMCSCVLRPENDITCLIFLTILFFETKLLTEPELIDSDCLANEFQGSTCLCIPVLVPDVCCCAQLLCGCWRSKSRSPCVHSKHSTDITISQPCCLYTLVSSGTAQLVHLHQTFAYMSTSLFVYSNVVTSPVRCHFRWHCSKHSSKCRWCTPAFQRCVVGSRGMCMLSFNRVLKDFPANVLIFTFINNVWKFQLTTFGINSSHLVNLVVLQ